ncbi:hypothetical protein SAMN06272735_2568 [Streptomyces sp. TLI_55]|uniref:hypothetical protein n=1 Tax=Streptomyces sp. TLI_55 TaxID=1938861 RepID=UPI000BD0AC21|nr:hypothetical protein [Streptomyces sp. TLI_55]SNX58086.1 hypothetical protein SAMN06272735_2568 [Streptomyces sp. TLI_55]
MSADRETNHDMTNSDITLLLADATDEVEIGIAPYEAVIRGGRRRKARRWAVAAATALVIAGSSATLAVAGLPGGSGMVTPPATQAPTATRADLYTAQRTLLATGVEDGKEWRVYIDVWAAPRNEAEAAGQLEAMGEYGDVPSGVTKASELIGKSSYVTFLSDGDGADRDNRRPVYEDAFEATDDPMRGTDVESAAIPFRTTNEHVERLVIGMVGKDAEQVTCTWRDGTKTKIDRPAGNTVVSTDQSAIRTAEGSPVDWFVCLAPKGTGDGTADVTGVR